MHIVDLIAHKWSKTMTTLTENEQQLNKKKTSTHFVYANVSILLLGLVLNHLVVVDKNDSES